MASLATVDDTLPRVDTTRQKWEIVSLIGGQAKQTHFVEYTVTVRVTQFKPVEKVLCQFIRTRRFNEFNTFKEALKEAYPSLQTTSTFPQRTWTRNGSKNVETIQRRIFWFREWLKELLDATQTKGVTNPAMISEMTAYWLYGDTETDKKLKQVDERKSYNSEEDAVIDALTVKKNNEEKFRLNVEKKWNKLVASKHIYHEELRVAMDQQIDQAKVLFQQRMLTEQMFYTRHANILQTGWTVKKYSKNKNIMGKARVQARRLWIAAAATASPEAQAEQPSNSRNRKSGETKASAGGSSGDGESTSTAGSARKLQSSTTQSWTVKWCDPKTSEFKREKNCTTMNIIDIQRNSNVSLRNKYFVTVKTDQRDVEFEFADSAECDCLIKCWEYVTVACSQMKIFVEALMKYKIESCHFIKGWKNIDIDMLLVEDMWFLTNGLEPDGSVGSHERESSVMKRGESMYHTHVEWMKILPSWIELKLRLSNAYKACQDGLQVLETMKLADHLAELTIGEVEVAVLAAGTAAAGGAGVAAAADGTRVMEESGGISGGGISGGGISGGGISGGGLGNLYDRLLEYSVTHTDCTTKLLQACRDCVSGVGGVTAIQEHADTSPEVFNGELRRRRHWVTVSQAIMKSVAIQSGRVDNMMDDGQMMKLLQYQKVYFGETFTMLRKRNGNRRIQESGDDKLLKRLVVWWRKLCVGASVGESVGASVGESVMADTLISSHECSPPATHRVLGPIIDNANREEEEEKISRSLPTEDDIPVDLA